MLSNPRALMPVEASKIILGNMEVLSTKEGQNIAMSILDGIYCNLDNK